eukprot:SAG11_NODE_449_length_9392_cov_16.435381_6_plen_579_part_00
MSPSIATQPVAAGATASLNQTTETCAAGGYRSSGFDGIKLHQLRFAGEAAAEGAAATAPGAVAQATALVSQTTTVGSARKALFCTSCGQRNAGTAFCTGCGSPASSGATGAVAAAGAVTTRQTPLSSHAVVGLEQDVEVKGAKGFGMRMSAEREVLGYAEPGSPAEVAGSSPVGAQITRVGGVAVHDKPGVVNQLEMLQDVGGGTISTQPAVASATAPVDKTTAVDPDVQLSSFLRKAGLTKYKDALLELGTLLIEDMEELDESDFDTIGMNQIEIKRLRRFLKAHVPIAHTQDAQAAQVLARQVAKPGQPTPKPWAFQFSPFPAGAVDVTVGGAAAEGAAATAPGAVAQATALVSQTTTVGSARKALFCTSCGQRNAGTAFCTGCGSPASALDPDAQLSPFLRKAGLTKYKDALLELNPLIEDMEELDESDFEAIGMNQIEIKRLRRFLKAHVPIAHTQDAQAAQVLARQVAKPGQPSLAIAGRRVDGAAGTHRPNVILLPSSLPPVQRSRPTLSSISALPRPPYSALSLSLPSRVGGPTDGTGEWLVLCARSWRRSRRRCGCGGCGCAKCGLVRSS